MRIRRLIAVVTLAVLATACGRLGTGLPGCRTAPDEPNAATILSIQAVPGAAYSPCLNSLQLGWDEVEFSARTGLVRLEFESGTESFLEVRLTQSCDIGDATEVPSDRDDVRRYERVIQVADEIGVTIVPDGERPRIFAGLLADRLADAMVEDRPLRISVDQDIDHPVRSRVNDALFHGDLVWIVGDLDIDEGTVEMRTRDEVHRGIDVDEALDEIEDMIPEIQYRGNWFFVFEGGCITYTFDAEGTLASSIAGDAEAAVGLYSNADLIEAARDAGYELEDE